MRTYSESDAVMELKGSKLSVDVNLNHLVGKAGSRSTPVSPCSPNPLDNERLQRRSTGLTAFNDYVDLVKRHLMYAVREEVEILKQQIGEMVERITQLEYENSVLKSEAKPETLNKLVVPRQVTQVTGQPPSATGVVQQLSGVVGGPLSTATPAPRAGGMGVGVVAGSTSVPAQPQQQPQQQQQQQQGGGVVASAATAAPTSVTVAAGSIPGGVVAQPQAGQPTVVASSQQGTLPPAQQQQQQQSLAAQVQQQQQQQQPPSSQTGQPASQVPAPGSGS